MRLDKAVPGCQRTNTMDLVTSIPLRPAARAAEDLAARITALCAQIDPLGALQAML
jgi:hypothetical protein